MNKEQLKKLEADLWKAADKGRDSSIYVYGQEKTLETVKLAKMNLAVNDLNGSVIQANTYTFKRMEIITPPKPLVQQFQKLVAPLFKAIETNLKANVSLKATRDALLPRLISGKLAVDVLDICFPPGMSLSD